MTAGDKPGPNEILDLNRQGRRSSGGPTLHCGNQLAGGVEEVREQSGARDLLSRIARKWDIWIEQLDFAWEIGDTQDSYRCSDKPTGTNLKVGTPTVALKICWQLRPPHSRYRRSRAV